PLAARRYDVAAMPLDGLRIAHSADLGHAAVSAEVRRAFETALATLAEQGAEIADDAFALDARLLEATLKPIAFTEQAAAVLRRDPSLLQRSEPAYRAVIERGMGYRGVDYV